MDNLAAHRGEEMRELVEGWGCEVLFLRPYSSDYNPIKEAFSKMKGLLRKARARTREGFIEPSNHQHWLRWCASAPST